MRISPYGTGATLRTISICLALTSACTRHSGGGLAPHPVNGPGPGQQAIGAAGGTVSVDGVEVIVPPGALTSAENITILRLTADDLGIPDDPTQFALFEFGPAGLQFAKPIIVRFDPRLVPSGSEATLLWSSDDPATGIDVLSPTPSTSLETTVMHFSWGGALFSAIGAGIDSVRGALQNLQLANCLKRGVGGEAGDLCCRKSFCKAPLVCASNGGCYMPSCLSDADCPPPTTTTSACVAANRCDTTGTLTVTTTPQSCVDYECVPGNSTAVQQSCVLPPPDLPECCVGSLTTQTQCNGWCCKASDAPSQTLCDQDGVTLRVYDDMAPPTCGPGQGECYFATKTQDCSKDNLPPRKCRDANTVDIPSGNCPAGTTAGCVVTWTGQACPPNQACDNGQCVWVCGHTGQLCCGDTSPPFTGDGCQDPGTVCQSGGGPADDWKCVACGGNQQPCCNYVSALDTGGGCATQLISGWQCGWVGSTPEQQAASAANACAAGLTAHPFGPNANTQSWCNCY